MEPEACHKRRWYTPAVRKRAGPQSRAEPAHLRFYMGCCNDQDANEGKKGEQWVFHSC